MSEHNSRENERIDKTPDGDRQQASGPSGEVFEEYGIVNLTESFPSEPYEWHREYSESVEDHVVVPFRVVERGFAHRKDAKRRAEEMNDMSAHEYHAVRLSDMRGL